MNLSWVTIPTNRPVAICDWSHFIQNDGDFDMQFEYGSDILIAYAFFMASISD